MNAYEQAVFDAENIRDAAHEISTPKKPRKPRTGIRTLTYPLIKAGMRKAGPLPDECPEDLFLIAWLAGAGYGRCCLPSLRLWFSIKEAMDKKHFGRRFRNSRTNFTFDSLSAATKDFGIQWPGQTKDSKKQKRKFQGDKSRSPQSTTLIERFEEWRKAEGPQACQWLRNHDLVPGSVRITGKDECKKQVKLASGSRGYLMTLEKWPRIRWNDELARRWHLNPTPLPLP